MAAEHIINGARPRLSDEEVDLIEQDDGESSEVSSEDGWVPWGIDDILSIKNIISSRMNQNQKEIIEAFLSGVTYEELGVSEKFYRYHYQKAVDFIKLELKL